MNDEVNQTPPEAVTGYTKDNYIRYTNDDVPVNEIGREQLNPAAEEFGRSSPSEDGDGGSSGKKLRFAQADPHMVAATFAVVSIVALGIVLDDSAFSSFFSPILGPISESFNISGDGTPYGVTFDMVLVPTDTDVTYSVNFEDVPDGELLLVVKEGSSTITSTSLDTTVAGTISNLTPGTTYQFSVTQDGSAIGATHSVTTLGTYDGSPIVKLLSAKNYNASERNDSDTGGYFKFQITVIDRNSVCSDFHAELSFTAGGQPYSVESDLVLDTVTEMQKLEILDDWIPDTVTEPISATLTITWNVSGGSSGSLTETVYI